MPAIAPISSNPQADNWMKNPGRAEPQANGLGLS